MLDVVVKDKTPAHLPSQNQVTDRHILNLTGGVERPEVRIAQHAIDPRCSTFGKCRGEFGLGSEWLDGCRKPTLRRDAIIPACRLNLVSDRSHEGVVVGEGVDEARSNNCCFAGKDISGRCERIEYTKKTIGNKYIK